MDTRVSVGMPVYNGAKWVQASIESVLSQRYASFELIISDNASTDATEDICRAFAARDSRVRFHRNAENIGVARNFTQAFRLTRGRYFKWMCCGDALEPSFLERCSAVLDRRADAALVYPVTRLFEHDPTQGVDAPDPFNLDVDDPVERFRTYMTRVRLNNIMHGVYRSEALARTHVYNPFLAGDVNMIAELLLQGRAVQLPEVLNFRRALPETMSMMNDDAALRRMYAPKSPSALKYQAWAATLAHFGAALGAPRLSPVQRVRLLACVLRLSLWRRDELVHELITRGQRT